MSFVVLHTPEFERWLFGLRDRSVAFRLRRRLDRVKAGNLGDIKSVGSGVFEMREFFGSGWRMYYTMRSGALVVMLGGGDKSSQSSDIERAISLASTLED